MERCLPQLICLLSAALAFVACVPLTHDSNQLALERHTLPTDERELISLADHYWEESRDLKSTAKGAAALEKAAREKTGFEISWRLSRHYAAIGELLDKRSLKRRFLQKAVKYGKLALDLKPARPEGYATLAVARGLFATTMIAPGKSYQETIEEPAEILMEQFPDYADGLGFRILGGLYTKAPPWPAGVGDLEGAIEVLEEGHQLFPQSTLTTFFLAEAYLKDGQRKKASSLLRTVLEAKPTGEWRLVGAHYRAVARQHLTDLSSTEVNRGH